ncbi:MAG: hypothetical protein CL912_22885 [Deltaproteobacteria bacterium]|nr:hypothetical protein [Deltaproteobacteria bacterium]
MCLITETQICDTGENIQIWVSAETFGIAEVFDNRPDDKVYSQKERGRSEQENSIHCGVFVSK